MPMYTMYYINIMYSSKDKDQINHPAKIEKELNKRALRKRY